MLRNQVRYVLDTSAFIGAFTRYYTPAVCPGFWEALSLYHDSGQLLSLDRVLEEIAAKPDKLYEWAKSMPATFFASTSDDEVSREYTKLKRTLESKNHYVGPAIYNFTRKVDSWLVAYAKATGSTVVSEKVHNEKSRSRVIIPNACSQFGVPCMNTFKMLRLLGVVLELKKP